MTTQNGPTVITIKVNGADLYNAFKISDPSIISQIANLRFPENASSGMPDIKEFCCLKDNQDNPDYLCGDAIKTMKSSIYPDSHVLWLGKLDAGSQNDYTLRLDLAVIDRESSRFFDRVLFNGNEAHILAFTNEYFDSSEEEPYLILLTVTPKKGNSGGKTFVLDPILKGIYK